MQPDIWNVLEIDKTSNEKEIKDAYRTKLRLVNPEDDSRGFMRLREAYEQAIRLCNEQKSRTFIKEDDTQQEPTEFDDSTNSIASMELTTSNFSTVSQQENDTIEGWLDRLDALYDTLSTRLDAACWKDLFQDEICLGIDTNLMVRGKLLSFLMNHFYLPTRIWQLIDSEFTITRDREELYEEFPRNFIDYIINHIQRENFLDYELFQIQEKCECNEINKDIDDYISTYFKLKEELDQETTESDKKVTCLDLIANLEKRSIYHPYQEVEKLRYYLLIEEIEKAVPLADRLLGHYPKDNYIRYQVAKLKQTQAHYEEAYRLYQEILQSDPKDPDVLTGSAECLLMLKQYTECKNIVMELLSILPQDKRAGEIMHCANEELIQQYQNKLTQSKKHTPNLSYVKSQLEDYLELAWCYYQNARFDESLSILEELPEEIHQEYDYINLLGRVYFCLDRYEVAIVHLKRWIETICNVPRDDSAFSKKCYRMLGYAYFCLGECYVEKKEYEEAMSYFLRSTEEENNISMKLSAMERLAYTYLQLKLYDDCIRICDDIVAISQDYYPAYLHRQEAYAQIGRDREVIEDYHTAIKIVPMLIQPYLAAMKVYLDYNHLEEAKEVVEQVKTHEIESTEFDLLAIQLMRRMADNDTSLEQALKECLDLKTRLYHKQNDMKDKSMVDLELAILYSYLRRYDEALTSINIAIQQNPIDDYRLLVKTRILKYMGKQELTLDILLGILIRNPQNEDACFEIAEYYLEKHEFDTALNYYKKTEKLNTAYRNVHEKMVDIYIDKYNETEQMQYYDLAIQHANKQLELEESYHQIINRGLVYIESYSFDKALADFQKAFEWTTEDWVAFNNIGYCYNLMRDVNQALEWLTKAVSKVSMDVAFLPYSNLAVCHLLQQQYDEAEAYYIKLHQIKPNTSRFIAKLSEINKFKGNFKKSVDWQMELLQFSNYSSAKVFQEIAEIFHLAGKLRLADNYYRKSISIEPNNPFSILAYAKFLLCSKSLRKSLRFLRRAVDCYVSNNMYDIAFCIEAAVLSWEYRFKEMSKNSNSKNLVIYENQAHRWGLQALEGIEEVYKSIELYIRYPACRAKRLVSMASIYLTMGDLEKAEQYIKQALLVKPCLLCTFYECVEAYELYGRLCEVKNQQEVAIEYYRKIIELNPGDAYHKKRLQSILEMQSKDEVKKRK